MSTTSVPTKPFELGICMAGAISAGAYTAGVLDFITQAMDEWEMQRGQPDIPQHRVILKGMSGASAGSMTAALFTATASHEIPPVPYNKPRETPTNNQLYAAWVDRIDIVELLRTDDQHYQWPEAAGKKVLLRSVLDSTILDKLAAEVFAPAPSAKLKPRPWIDGDFHALLALSNLRGVPYHLPMHGGPGHLMSLHADFASFVRNKVVPAGSFGIPIDPDSVGGENRTFLANAALSSGAFPLFLAPRKVTRRDAVNFYTDLPSIQGIAPFWPPAIQAQIDGDPNQMYGYWTVDGGALNNEPLDLIRNHLDGGGPITQANPIPAREVEHVVLMIDPFVGFDPNAYADDTSTFPELLGLAGSTFSATKMQARFRPQELVRAAKEEDYSHYMIAPVRSKEGSSITDVTAIACGSLGGFGGFISHKFRVHDYHLGRRNAQRFLRRHFALEIDPTSESQHNACFGVSDQEAIRRGAEWRKTHPSTTGDDWTPWHFTETVDGVAKHYRPICPVLGAAAVEALAVEWPRYTDKELDALEPLIEERLKFVSGRARDSISGGKWYISSALTFGLWLARSGLVSKIKSAIRGGLTGHDHLLA